MQYRQSIIFSLVILHLHTLHAAPKTCIKIPPRKFNQVAGILSVDIIDEPDFVIFQKPICISTIPSIVVKINNVTLNLLNTTISDEGCRDLYEKLLCPTTKTILPNRCKQAHHIMFAIIQSLPECKIEKDCVNEYELNDLECSWMTELQNAVCDNMKVVNFKCEKEKSKAVYIKDMCFLTNPTCNFIVTYVVPLSVVTGLLWSFMTIFIIYFGQFWCNKVEDMENKVDAMRSDFLNVDIRRTNYDQLGYNLYQQIDYPTVNHS
jgi:hypothetical protein